MNLDNSFEDKEAVHVQDQSNLKRKQRVFYRFDEYQVYRPTQVFFGCINCNFRVELCDWIFVKNRKKWCLHLGKFHKCKNGSQKTSKCSQKHLPSHASHWPTVSNDTAKKLLREGGLVKAQDALTLYPMSLPGLPGGNYNFDEKPNSNIDFHSKSKKATKKTKLNGVQTDSPLKSSEIPDTTSSNSQLQSTSDLVEEEEDQDHEYDSESEDLDISSTTCVIPFALESNEDLSERDDHSISNTHVSAYPLACASSSHTLYDQAETDCTPIKRFFYPFAEYEVCRSTQAFFGCPNCDFQVEIKEWLYLKDRKEWRLHLGKFHKCKQGPHITMKCSKKHLPPHARDWPTISNDTAKKLLKEGRLLKATEAPPLDNLPVQNKSKTNKSARSNQTEAQSELGINFVSQRNASNISQLNNLILQRNNLMRNTVDPYFHRNMLASTIIIPRPINFQLDLSQRLVMINSKSEIPSLLSGYNSSLRH